MGQGGRVVLVPLSAGVRRRVEHYSFASFVLSWAFDSALANLVYQRSAKIHWYSKGTITFRFLYGFANCRVYAFGKVAVPSRKRGVSGG